MNENDIANLGKIIAGEIREGDIVNVTVTSRDGKTYVSVTNAPSWIIDAITDEQMVLDLEDGTEELDGQTEMFEEEEPEVEEEFAPIVLELPEAVAEDEFEEESDEEE